MKVKDEKNAFVLLRMGVAFEPDLQINKLQMDQRLLAGLRLVYLYTR